MPVSVIPFRMPEPIELPAHLQEDVRRRPAEEAAARALRLLVELGVAEVALLEWVGAAGTALVGLEAADPDRARALRRGWTPTQGGPDSQRPPTESLAAQAIAAASALLLVGTVQQGDAGPLPAWLTGSLLAGRPSVDLGFVYVLPLSEGEGRSVGALTLVRATGAGPLNHDQPAIAEAFRRLLEEVLRR